MTDDVLRAIIVDDEALARRAVRQQLDRHPEVRVLAECATGAEAVRAITAHDPDLVFLDIQMPGGSGFDVLDRISDAGRPAVVFVTAYSEYAVKAFEVNAVDYVLKPVDDSRFDAALSRVRARLRSAESHDAFDRIRAVVQTLARSPQEGAKRARRIAISDGDKTIMVPIDEIVRLETAGNYVRVHTVRRKILTRATLARVVDMLADSRFLRVHRSAVVNSDAIVEIGMAGKGLYVLGLSDGSKVETSYHYRPAVAQLLRPR
ncbi:MAG: LytR/AlgR family response regulator transcription factor [Gemmatimonadaceae bacterium]